MPSVTAAGQGEVHCSDQGDIAPGAGVWFWWLPKEASGSLSSLAHLVGRCQKSLWAQLSNLALALWPSEKEHLI